MPSRVRLAVVGHVEWVTFAAVHALPARGTIVHAHEHFDLPGGGGAVAAVQLARIAGSCTFLTAVGGDSLGERAVSELGARGVDVHAARRESEQRRAFTHLDDGAERTITVLGDRLVPHGAEPLPWDRLATLDGVYFTGGDDDALRAARAAPVLVATIRAREALFSAGVQLDALVASATDPDEQVQAGTIDPPPRRIVLTRGDQGGSWTGLDGKTGAWAAAPLPGEPVDAYGCGDTFAAALTYGLAARLPIDAALDFAARCGAACLCGRGPYGVELPAPPGAKRSPRG